MSEEPRCPRCDSPVPVVINIPDSGDQLTPERLECPGCGAALERAVDGHADHGWRLADVTGGMPWNEVST